MTERAERSERAERFRQLHESGLFVMPNPWDRGSARMLEEAGFTALATTSAGLGRAIGKDDQEVDRDELVAHVAELAAMLSVPLSVDSERLFPDDEGGIAETVRRLAAAGAVGCSIEDYDPTTASIDQIDDAARAVEAAASACSRHDLTLTARAENHLYGAGDLDDTIERLHRYRDAGADVLYAPGLTRAGDIGRVVDEVGGPVNVLALDSAPSIDELRALDVRRVSLGSRLFNAAYDTLRRTANELRTAEIGAR